MLKKVHISEIPPELIRVRDRWRYFWSWIPIIGELYRRFIYVRRMNRWLEDNKVDVIIH